MIGINGVTRVEVSVRIGGDVVVVVVVEVEVVVVVLRVVSSSGRAFCRSLVDVSTETEGGREVVDDEVDAISLCRLSAVTTGGAIEVPAVVLAGAAVVAWTVIAGSFVVLEAASGGSRVDA